MARAWTERIDWKRVALDLERLPHGERSIYIRQVAESVGRSVQTVYRVLQIKCGTKRKISRKRTKVTHDLLTEVMRLKALSHVIRPAGRDLSTHECLKIMQEDGFPGAEAVSVSGVNTALRAEGFMQRKVYRRVLANYACETYQKDYSRSKFFQLHKPDPERPGDWLLRVSARELHYKQEGRRLRTWVVQLKDEYSSLRLVRAYPATGESYVLGLTFLRWCFNREPDAHFMHRYLMERLKCDQGSFRKRTEVKSIAEALGFELPSTQQGNKESQGKVESGFASAWQTFEQPLAVRLVDRHGPGCMIRLSEYNELIHQHMISEHDMPHPYWRMQTRGELFQQSVLTRRPKTLDVDLLTVSFSVVERTVDAYGTVSVNNLRLACPGLEPQQRVRILINREGRFICEPLRDGADPFEVYPAKFNRQGEFNHVPPTKRERAERDVKRRLKEQGRKRKVVPMLPQTEPTEVKSPFVDSEEAPTPRTMNKLDTMAYIGRALDSAGVARAIIEHLSADIAQLVGSGLTEEDAEAVVSDILTLYRKAV